MTGKVKFFNGKKGFGFITPDDGTSDVYCHQTEVLGGHGPLLEGQAVDYEVVQGDRGLKAVGVRPV